MARFVVVACLGAVIGCGGEQVEPAAPAPSPPAAPAPAPIETAAATTPSAAPAASGAPAEAPAKKGPAHWKDYAGPKKAATQLSTKKAWGVVPVGLDGKFDIVKIALEDYGKPAGEEQMLLGFDKQEIFVPAALVQPQVVAKGLAKGDAMMVNVAASSGYGRVTSIEKGDGERVKFKYAWGGSPSEGELPLDEIVKLEDKLAYGHPVAIKDGERWTYGVLVYTDPKTSFALVPGGGTKQIETKDLKPLKLRKPLAKGAKVSAYGGSFIFEPGKIVDVLDDGAQYKVKLDSGKEETLPMEKVSAPL